MAFKLISRQTSMGELLEEIQGKASTTFTEGEALEFTNGYLGPVNAQTDKPTHICKYVVPDKSVMRPSTDNATTTLGEKVSAIPCAGTGLVFETEMLASIATDCAPPINGTAVNSGSTTTALVTAAGSTNDYVGGTIYFPQTDTHHKITADSVTTGVHTFTFEPAAPRAIGSGDTARVIPVSNGGRPKLSGTAYSKGVSMAVADKTGGNLEVMKVDLRNYKLWVRFLDS